LKHVSI